MTTTRRPTWLPKEIDDMYNAASDKARHFIYKLSPASQNYTGYNTSNYICDPNKNKTNYAYATLILDQLATEFNLSPIFRLEYSEFTTIHCRREHPTTYYTKSYNGGLILYQDVTAMFRDQAFLIQIDTDKCRPLHIHFSHILSRNTFSDMPQISGEWPNNIEKVKHEMKKQMMIKIVET